MFSLLRGEFCLLRLNELMLANLIWFPGDFSLILFLSTLSLTFLVDSSSSLILICRPVIRYCSYIKSKDMSFLNTDAYDY